MRKAESTSAFFTFLSRFIFISLVKISSSKPDSSFLFFLPFLEGKRKKCMNNAKKDKDKEEREI